MGSSTTTFCTIEMLASESGQEASQKAAYDAAIKSGMSKATAEKLYGRG